MSGSGKEQQQLAPIRIGALCCAYDDPRWIGAVLEGILPVVDEILLLVGRKPWNGAAAEVDHTLRAAFGVPGVEGRIRYLVGDWPNETAQRNFGLALLQRLKLDYALIVDADELYDPTTLLSMREALRRHPEISVWFTSMYTYWKSFHYRIDPPEEFTPAVFLKIGQAQFRENRHAVGKNWSKFPPEIGVCHHLSYARSDEEVLAKIGRFSHSHEIARGWYESVWLKWYEQMENLHPVTPPIYKKAIRQRSELYPPTLRRLWEGEQVQPVVLGSPF